MLFAIFHLLLLQFQDLVENMAVREDVLRFRVELMNTAHFTLVG